MARSFIGIVEEEEEEDKVYCPYCDEHRQKIVYLKVRETVELEGVTEGELQRLQIEADRWRQCPECYSKWLIRSVPHTDHDIDLPWGTDLENDVGENDVGLFTHKQNKKTGRLARYRNQSARNKIPKDKEALDAMKKGQTVTNFTEYQVGLE